VVDNSNGVIYCPNTNLADPNLYNDITDGNTTSTDAFDLSDEDFTSLGVTGFNDCVAGLKSTTNSFLGTWIDGNCTLFNYDVHPTADSDFDLSDCSNYGENATEIIPNPCSNSTSTSSSASVTSSATSSMYEVSFGKAVELLTLNF
jgi:hypothetical protein